MKIVEMQGKSVKLFFLQVGSHHYCYMRMTQEGA